MKHTILTLFGFLLLMMPTVAQAGEYTLVIDREPVNITGNTVNKITINGTIPGPTLRFKEGEDVTINVTNKLKEDSSVHWHGFFCQVKWMVFLALMASQGSSQVKHSPINSISVKAAHTGITPTLWGKNRMVIMVLSLLRPKGKDPVQADRDYVVVAI